MGAIKITRETVELITAEVRKLTYGYMGQLQDAPVHVGVCEDLATFAVFSGRTAYVSAATYYMGALYELISRTRDFVSAEWVLTPIWRELHRRGKLTERNATFLRGMYDMLSLLTRDDAPQISGDALCITSTRVSVSADMETEDREIVDDFVYAHRLASGDYVSVAVEHVGLITVGLELYDVVARADMCGDSVTLTMESGKTCTLPRHWDVGVITAKRGILR